MKNLIIFAVCCYFIFAFIHYLGKNKKPCKRALLSVFIGPALLFAINIFSTVLGVYIPLSELSFAVSIAGGIPGVATLIVTSMLI